MTKREVDRKHEGRIRDKEEECYEHSKKRGKKQGNHKKHKKKTFGSINI